MTLKQLRELMEHRGLEGVQKIEGLGGCTEVARKLNTSVSAGLSGDRSDLEHRLACNEGYPNVPEDFTITEKAPTRAFSWLKAPTSSFTFNSLLPRIDSR